MQANYFESFAKQPVISEVRQATPLSYLVHCLHIKISVTICTCNYIREIESNRKYNCILLEKNLFEARIFMDLTVLTMQMWKQAVTSIHIGVVAAYTLCIYSRAECDVCSTR